MKNIQTAYEILAEARRSKNILNIDKRDYTYIKAHMYSIFECYANGLLSWGQVEDKWYKSVNAYTDLFKENAALYNQQRAFMLDEYRRIMTEYKQPLDEYKTIHEKKMVTNLVIKTHLSESAAITASKKYYNRVLSESQLRHIAKMSSWNKVMEFYPNLTKDDEARVRLLSLFEKPTMSTTKMINVMTEEPVRRLPTPARKKVEYTLEEAFDMIERELTSGEKSKREREVKKLKPHKKEFTDRYGKRGENVMYAVATKRAKKKKSDVQEEKSCWKGYKKVGTKMKGGKKVNDCVKETTTAGGIAAVAAPMGKPIKRKTESDCGRKRSKKRVQITSPMGVLQKEAFEPTSGSIHSRDQQAYRNRAEQMRDVLFEPTTTPHDRAMARRELSMGTILDLKDREADYRGRFSKSLDTLKSIYGYTPPKEQVDRLMQQSPSHLLSDMEDLRSIVLDPTSNQKRRDDAYNAFNHLAKRYKTELKYIQDERDNFVSQIRTPIAQAAERRRTGSMSNRKEKPAMPSLEMPKLELPGLRTPEMPKTKAGALPNFLPKDSSYDNNRMELPDTSANPMADLRLGNKKRDRFAASRSTNVEETYDGNEFFETYGHIEYTENMLTEAEYQGRKVTLNKPMRGDVKKFKVYVKNEKGNVVKVNFGDPDMKIKKSNPKRRKSFRARHNCDNPGPKTKARYWSCRKW